MTEFQKIKSLVLSTLGLQSFATEKDKVVFTEDQKTAIRKEYALFGEGFVEKFSEALNNEIANTSAQDQAQALKTMLDSVRAESAKQISEMKLELQSAKADIAKLSKAPELEEEIKQIQGAKTVPFQINKKAKHNKYVEMMMSGELPDDVFASGATMDVDDLKAEFGTYISQTDKPILKKLTQPTTTMKFMTTKVAITEWQAIEASWTSVVQQFNNKWTPKSTGKFTPIRIINRRHKINVAITPDHINDSWLSYLYDEGLTPEQMPITKYIIYEHIIPRVADDREKHLIATGKYTPINPVLQTGDAGQETGLSMDGFITQLVTLYENRANNNVNFINLGQLTHANVLDKMEMFVDSIDRLMRKKTELIFMSDTNYKLYKRTYRDTYPTSKNDDKNEDKIDFSSQRLQVLDSMDGINHFFTTPQENFIRLRHKNDGSSKIWLQAVDYDVKVFAEWWEACGFAIEEAIFAYIDPLQVIQGYAVAGDAANLKDYMLTEAGVTGYQAGHLADYKTAIEAAGTIADLAALQAIITLANA